jgi:hypothetical protein
VRPIVEFSDSVVFVPQKIVPAAPARTESDRKDHMFQRFRKKERSGLQSACDELIDKGAIITGE